MPKKTRTQEDREALYKRVSEELLPFLAKEPPKLGNATSPTLVDTVGDFKVMHGDLEAQIKMLNNVIDSKMTDEEKEAKKVKGDNYNLKLVPMTQYRVSATLADNMVVNLCHRLNECYKQLGHQHLLLDPEQLKADIRAPVDMTQHRYEER
jgi:hypothetical protein